MFDLMGSNILLGLSHALSVSNLFYCFAGVALGTLLGAIPGIGVLAAISMLYPITFYLDPLAAIIMLAGIYYGTAYGGSIASILLNLPGTPSNAVACLDGYPMAKQGRAGVALMITTVASFVGASIGIAIMMVFSPMISEYALNFGDTEYFSLMMLGLISAAMVSPGSPLKGLASALLGVAFGLVGADAYRGVYRYTFGIESLVEGVSLVALAMGLFGIAEIVFSIPGSADRKVDSKGVTMRSMIPEKGELKRSWMPILRGSAFGSFFGALPGTGGLLAAYMTYTAEKKLAKDPSRFGNGAIEGVAGPEAANNAADQTAFIPTMSLGIPGTPSMAIMIGILMLHGITPGPRMISDHPDVFWGLVMSFWVGNLMLLVLNIPLIGIWVRILAIPYKYLYPSVLVFVCIGVMSINNNAFDVWMTLAFATIGCVMTMLKFPSAPLILGFILGPMVEVNFRRALVLSGGEFGTFFAGPINMAVMSMVGLILAWALFTTLVPMVRNGVARRRGSSASV